MSKGAMEDDGTSGRGVIRPAPAHIRTITTTGHITTVPNTADGQVAAAHDSETCTAPPDAVSQLKAQQQRGEFGHDG